MTLSCAAASAFVAPGRAPRASARFATVSTPEEVAARAAAAAAAAESPPPTKDAIEPPASLFGSKTTATAPSTTPEPPAPAYGARIMPGRYADTTRSATTALLPRPTNLDGSHAGDFGFDPFGLSPTDGDLYVQMEAELKHGRIAMLAVIGWPLAEMVAPNVGLGGLLAEGGRAPSVLNGHLLDNPLALVTTLAFFGGVGAFEYFFALRPKASTRLGALHREDMEEVWNLGVAGDYDFDPLGLYSTLGNDAVGRKAMRDVEVANGRAAMVGIATFALLEAATGKPITEIASIFFQPNLALPVLAAAWSFFNTVAEVSDVREYPIRVQWRAGGEETAMGAYGAVASAGSAIAGKVEGSGLKMPALPKLPEF